MYKGKPQLVVSELLTPTVTSLEKKLPEQLLNRAAVKINKTVMHFVFI